MEGQKCQVMRWRPIIIERWGYNPSRRRWMIATHAWRVVLCIYREDYLSDSEESCLANITGDMSIQKVAINPKMVTENTYNSATLVSEWKCGLPLELCLKL